MLATLKRVSNDKFTKRLGEIPTANLFVFIDSSVAVLV